MVSLRSTLEKPCAPRWQSIFSLPQNWDRLFHSTPPANFPSADTAFSSPLLKLLHSWKAYGCILDYNRLENKGPDFVSLVCCRNRGWEGGEETNISVLCCKHEHVRSSDSHKTADSVLLSPFCKQGSEAEFIHRHATTNWWTRGFNSGLLAP